MQLNHRKAFNTLKKMGVPVYEHPDDRGNFSISAEEAESDNWVSYYSAPSDWVFGVHPSIEATLLKHGLFTEWVNPGRLSVYNI